MIQSSIAGLTACLNAPFGARCFLTLIGAAVGALASLGLNAPFGARCFLTGVRNGETVGGAGVLMHLLALGGF